VWVRVRSTSASLCCRSARSSGHEIEHPMAVVILGGLFTSTLLNLFLLPAIYLRFGERRRVEGL
jgi:Cu/Ag efflux pump CusA